MRASTQRALVALAVILTWTGGGRAAQAGDGPRLSPGVRNERGCTVSGCHASVAAGRHVHGPVAAGFCTVCHRPEPGASVERPTRAGKHRFRLIARGAKLCRTCHEDAWLERVPSGHAPVAEGRCGSCHDPHSSDHVFQLRSSVPALCAQCHKAETAPRKKPHRPVTTERSCLVCHDPHVSGWPRLLPEASVVDTCARCHPKSVKRMRAIATAGLHGPVRTGDCAACHDPHGGKSGALFPAGEAAACVRCHDPKKLFVWRAGSGQTRFRDGTRNLHALHARAKPRARCASCHDPHGEPVRGEGAGATGQHHLRAEVRKGRGAPQALGFRATPGGGTCAKSCHAPSRYDRGGS